MRYVLETVEAQDLQRGHILLLAVSPLRFARILAVRIDSAKDHPAWTGPDQVVAILDVSESYGTQGTAIFTGRELVLLLAPAGPELIVLPEES